MRVSDEQDLVAQLRELGYRVDAPRPKPKPVRCSICGAVENDVIWSPERYDTEGIDLENVARSDWMTRIKVEVNESGEEGWDYVIKNFCDMCDEGKVEALKKLGYTTHHHGSTHPLADDENCTYNCSQQGSPYDED